MAREPKVEDLIRIADVPQVVLEMTGVNRKVDTVRKWATKGVAGYDGTLVKLQTCRRIRAIFTTREWLREFFGRL